MTSAKKKGEDVQQHLLRIQSFVAMWITWVLAVVSAVAPTLFRTVLGANWEPAAPLFRILAVGGVALGLSQISYWAFLVEGKTRELLKYNLISKPMTTLFVVAGAFVSLEGTAAGLSAALVLSWLMNVWWLQRTAGLDGKAFYLNAARIVGAGAAAAGAGMLAPTGWFGVDLLYMAATATVSSLVFFGAVNLTAKGRCELRDAIGVLKDAIHR